MFRFFLTLAFFCFISELISQDMSIDSARIAGMRSQLKDAKQIYQKNLDSAFLKLDEIEGDFREFGDPDLWVEFLLQKAYFYLASEEHDSVLALLNPVFEEYPEISLSNKANTYQHIGHAYKVAWVPDSAMVNYIRALKLYERANDQRGLSVSYLALGLIYGELENKKMASYFYDKSIEYSTNSKIVEVHKQSINNPEPDPVAGDNTLDLALDIAKIAEEQDSDRLRMVAYADLKKNYFAVRDYDQALEYAMKELELIEITSSKAFLANNQAFVADIFQLQNKTEKAIQKYTEALPNATDSLRLDIYKKLKDSYRKVGNSVSALGVLESYVALKDSIDDEKTQASIAKVMAQFKTELQEEQIKSLSYQNELNEVQISRQRTTLYGTVGTGLLLFILGYLGYKNYKTRQELGQTQLNFKLLRTQMNPHFMFNALNEIKLNMATSDKEQTKQNLNAYSKMMRLVLESSNKEFVPLKKDIDLLRNYLEMQQLVYQNSFSFRIDVDQELDINYLAMPPMLTQPFVENAIIHGVKPIENGEISVRYISSEEDVAVVITDTGIGMDVESDSNNKEDHESYATSNISQRIETYEKLHNFKIDLKIDSKKDNGTKITLTFPQLIKGGQ